MDKKRTLDELQRSHEKKSRYAFVTKFLAISNMVGNRNKFYKRGPMTQKNASRCGKDGATIINSGKLKVVRRRSFFFPFSLLWYEMPTGGSSALLYNENVATATSRDFPHFSLFISRDNFKFVPFSRSLCILQSNRHERKYAFDAVFLG